MIYIVDYGLGNLASIKNMFKHIDIRDVKITSDKSELEQAEKIILPGVGAFDNGMQHLEKYDLLDVLNKKALIEKIPFLGICLGMQLMTKGSEEGQLSGLGWFDAQTLRFNDNNTLKIPHMGWNYINSRQNGKIFVKKDKRYRFYFVHSYYVKCKNDEHVMFETNYGIKFHSGIKKENLIGMQFHPEKSLHFGMDIFRNFAKL